MYNLNETSNNFRTNNNEEEENTPTQQECGTERGPARTTLVSRNVTVNGRRTSVRLEPEMWSSLREIAKRESCSIHDICTLVSLRKHEQTSLTAAIRVFLMLYFRAASTEDGHLRAGHGSFERMRERARVPMNDTERFKSRMRVGAQQSQAMMH